MKDTSIPARANAWRNWILPAATGLSILVGGLIATGTSGTAIVVVLVSSAGLAFFAISTQRTAALWIHPGWLMFLGAAPGLFLAYTVSAQHFQAAWNSPKYFTGDYLVLSILCLGAAILGAVLGGRSARSGLVQVSPGQSVDQRVIATVSRVAFWTFVATVFGYLAWIGLAMARGLNPGTIQAILSGVPGALSEAKRSVLAPAAGLTSFVQLAPLSVAALVLLARADSSRRRTVVWGITVLFVLAAGRALLYGERLALIEVGVALVVALLLPLTQRTITVRSRALLALSPVVLPVVLLVVFGSFEYLRSWSTFYSASTGGPYFEFVADRVGAYYATASNNGALLLEMDPRDSRIPYFSFAWLWDLPQLSSLYAQFSGFDILESTKGFLARSANPEFNNLGGILAPVFDFGIAFGVLAWFGIGVALGTVFARAVSGSMLAQLAYPVLVVGCLEVGRILYWTESRAFPQLLACAVLAVFLARRTQPRAQRSQSTANQC